MNHIIGDILPYAVTIAISPVPIIAVILMLMSPRPRPLALSFVAGWLTGVTIAIVGLTLLAGLLPKESGEGSRPVVGAIQLLLGAALLLLAIKQWRARPAPGETAPLPKWMSAIESMNPGAALVLAFVLAAVNPKNLMMSIAAATVIAQGAEGAGTITVAIVVFVLLAATSVALPVLIYLLTPAKAATALDSMRAWLTANNGTIMAVLFVVLGIQLVGKGIGSF